MAQFHHHPDGIVYVRGEVGRVYSDTAANFAKDFGEASTLPAGVIERFYDDDKESGRHHLFDAGYNQVPGGERPFHFGDLAIRRLELLLNRQAERMERIELKSVPASLTPARTASKPASVSIGTNRV